MPFLTFCLQVESIQAIENHTGYARQSLASKDYSRALYNIEQALQFAPQSSALNVLKGEILIGQQKYGEALVLAQYVVPFFNFKKNFFASNSRVADNS